MSMSYYRLCGRIMVAFLAVSNTCVIAANVSWLGGDGDWSNPVRWSPLGVPSAADTAFIGNLGVEDATVTLDQDDTISGLVITDLMRFDSNGNNLFVNGTTSIDGGAGVFGSASFINLRLGSIFTTQDLALSNGGSIFLDDGRYDVTGTLTIDADSSLAGDNGSTIRLFSASGPSFVNDGDLLGRFDGGLVIQQVSSGRIDLDGATGQGVVGADHSNIPGTEHSTLTIIGDELHDDFNGKMRLAQGGTINMNLSNGWTMGAGSLLEFAGELLSQLNGSQVTLSSGVSSKFQAKGRINVDAILENTVDVELLVESELDFHGNTQIEGGQYLLLEDATLEFDGITEVEGGDFSLGEDAELHFNEETDVAGGTFSTFSNLSSEGAVRFNGETTWRGDATVNGIALQNGDATVSAISNIDAGVFDMDGGGGTTWNINSNLIVTAESIDSTISNTFDGAINVSGAGFIRSLRVNLTGSFDEWTMNGEMNLASGLFPATRLAGSPMRLTGELNVTGAGVRILADTDFDSPSTTTMATTDLLMGGQTTVAAGATFIGDGTFVNLADGSLKLEDGASLDQVGLQNSGLLEVGDSPGIASVDRFENTDDGTWLVEIGGYVAGSESDLLLVTSGTTQLDGLIEVDLIDAGGGLFLPQIGDEFMVLTSFGAVGGVFQNEPISFAAGQAFHWEVLYHPNDVTLRLVDITNVIPEPSMFALLLLGAAFCFGSRWHKCIA